METDATVDTVVRTLLGLGWWWKFGSSRVVLEARGGSLQETNFSHLRKRKNHIHNCHWFLGYVSSLG